MITGLVGMIATLYFGYDWFMEDVTNTEARNYFLTGLFVFVAALFGWLYSILPGEDDLKAGDEWKKHQRIMYAQVEDAVAHEVKNLEQLRKGQQKGQLFEGTHLKAVAEYPFTEIRDQVHRVKHLWRFTFLVPAILREINAQLRIEDKNKRNPNKLIPLVERFLSRIKPIVPSDEELSNPS